MRSSYVRSIVPRAPRTMAFVSLAGGLLAIGLLEPRADAVAQGVQPSVATAVTVPGAGPGAVLPAGLTYVQSIEGVHEYQLANGLQVLLLPDVSAPKMTVNIVYRVGSRHESYGETGMAHLLEHLVFKGTPRHPNIPAEFKQRGASFNGTTNFDRTNYFETFGASEENLAWALELEADRMVNSFIARKDLDSEMTVVRNEFEIGETNPGRVLWQSVTSTMFRWHNYGKSTIGNRSDIENVSIERLQDFYRRYYRPDNATLIVAGKIELPATVGLIAKHFGAIAKPNTPIEPQYTVEPTQNGERSATVRRVSDSKIVSVAYRVMSGQHQDAASLRVLADLIGNAPNGRLHKRLVETGKATSASMDFMAGYDPGRAGVTASLRKQDDADAVRDDIVKIVEGLANEPATDAEVARAKADYAASFEVFRTNTQSIAIALTSAVAVGDWRLLFWERDQMAKVTAADVQRVALHYFKRDNRTIGMFLPAENLDRAEIPGRPDTAALLKDYRGGTAVVQGEDFDPSQANIDKRTVRQTLPTGLKLAMLPKLSAGDRIQGQLTLQFGQADTLKGLGAAPSMLGALLNKGTRRLNSGALSDELTRLKAQLSISAGANSVTASFATTKENLEPLMRLMVECLREPALLQDEFDQIKRSRLQSIEASLKNPQSAAANRLGVLTNAYAPDHPYYGGTPAEQRERLERVTLDDVKRFHSGYYGASRGQLSVVGVFDPDAVTKLTRDLLGNWPSAQPYARIPIAQTDVPALSEVIELADQANATFIARHQIKMKDADSAFPALMIANSIFGAGTMASRLGTRLRQKEGLSYSAGSSVNVGTFSDLGSFSISASYAPKAADRLEAAICEELGLALKDGFTAEELVTAKDGMLSGRRMNRTNDAALVSALGSNLYSGRTMQWSADFDAKIKALTLDQVNAAFRQHIDPARLVIIKAGSFGTGPQSVAAPRGQSCKK